MKYAKSVLDGNVVTTDLNLEYLIRDELLTECECRKKNLDFYSGAYFKQIDIPKSRTFWSFGARFEIKEEQ